MHRRVARLLDRRSNSVAPQLIPRRGGYAASHQPLKISNFSSRLGAVSTKFPSRPEAPFLDETLKYATAQVKKATSASGFVRTPMKSSGRKARALAKPPTESTFCGVPTAQHICWSSAPPHLATSRLTCPGLAYTIGPVRTLVSNAKSSGALTRTPVTIGGVRGGG